MQDNWVKDLERAFAPYMNFVEDVFDRLQQVSSETPVPVVSRSNREPKRVLMVDKVEINRVLFGHYFKRFPVHLEFASTIEAAAISLKEKQFDLVAVDVALSLDFQNAEMSVPFVAINPKETPKDQLVGVLAQALWP